MARRKSKKSYRSRSSFGGLNKWVKIAAFAVGGAALGATVLPSVDSRLTSAAAGFFAGGPLGAGVGYLAGPMLAQKVLGGGNGNTQGDAYNF